ncbi:hypothetical protein FISHEDRAFT_75440 [Fistulina hepatica ATCC 64428]|uniref:Uncharacterized protein n=1 Tax=Fistulina hepatica ATCC 64428 TaxID=1128425 RepID=A0A0D7A7A5_9AGAR|nr:hypothetical protein FISHEDRAFT_75440 [Fistulina hepatica ATCC 64428]
MNFARHSISSTNRIHIFDAQFDADAQIFTASTPFGFAIYRSFPLELVRKREIKGGTLSLVVPLHMSSLLFLVGGGRSPRYSPNKVIFWDDVAACEVAELEFREPVRGLACRRGWLAVALRRRVVLFEIGEQVSRYGEWDTCENPRGLLALATAAYATLLAIPGRQTGHVQLVHLSPCKPPAPLGPPPPVPPKRPPPPPTKSPISVIAAHVSALTSLSMPPSGRLLATTSATGTLVRVWDALTGALLREFRRGSDKADIYGVAFRPDERELCVWSDKGTVHVFTMDASGMPSRQSTLSQLSNFLPLQYLKPERSYAQFRIPTQSAHISLSPTTATSPTGDVLDQERCVVGWIEVPNSENLPISEYQLIVLTYAGGWYRVSVPRSSASSVSTTSSSVAPTSSVSAYGVPTKSHHRRPSSISSVVSNKGKGKDREKEQKESRDCALQEFRRFGQWDAWS